MINSATWTLHSKPRSTVHSRHRNRDRIRATRLPPTPLWRHRHSHHRRGRHRLYFLRKSASLPHPMTALWTTKRKKRSAASSAFSISPTVGLEQSNVVQSDSTTIAFKSGFRRSRQHNLTNTTSQSVPRVVRPSPPPTSIVFWKKLLLLCLQTVQTRGVLCEASEHDRKKKQDKG